MINELHCTIFICRGVMVFWAGWSEQCSEQPWSRASLWPREPPSEAAAMVTFTSCLSEDQARSFLENLSKLSDMGAVTHTAQNCRATVPAPMFHPTRFYETMMVTLTWTQNTRRIQVQSAMPIVDEAARIVDELATCYRTWLEENKVVPPPPGAEKAAGSFTKPPVHSYITSKIKGEKAMSSAGWETAVHVPQDLQYATALAFVVRAASHSGLTVYPTWHRKLLQFLVTEMGADAAEQEEHGVEQVPGMSRPWQCVTPVGKSKAKPPCVSMKS